MARSVLQECCTDLVSDMVRCTSHRYWLGSRKRDGGIVQSRSGRRRGSNFTVGAEQAEADPLLHSAFYQSDDYATISSKDDPRCFLIARTGSGKSAALQQLHDENPDHVVKIVPEDLSLEYITNLGVMRYLDSLDVHLDPLFIALWKHVLLIELIRHRYNVDSPAAKANFLKNLRDKIKKDAGKQAALDYLDQFQDKFWVETDERVKEVTDKFEEQIKAEAKGKLTFGKGAEASVGTDRGDTFSSESKIELADRFQRIVNETQMARLNKMLKVLDEDILESRQHFTYVVIDDLDRDWVDERLANALIRCLFRAVLDLVRVRNLKIIVALRTNIFEHLDFGHRSGGQEEKFRSLSLRMRWNGSELEDLVGERLRVASSSQENSSVNTVYDILPKTNSTRGNAFQYMMKRTLMRPRDIIAFFNEAFSISAGGERLTWDEIHNAEASYSTNRLLALRDEWKPSYPDIDRAFFAFRGAMMPMLKEDFTSRLDDIALLLADRHFRGGAWLERMTVDMWESTSGDWATLYGPLVTMLYNIGFIGCAIGSRPVQYAQTAPDFAERMSNLILADRFLIHPAFQIGLDVKSTSHSD